MTKLIMAAVALGVFMAPSPAVAQQRFAFELRGGAALPTQDIGSDDLETGFGFEGTLRYRFLPHFGVYAGWDWMHFNPETSFAGADIDFEETGYAFGVRFEHPFGEGAPLAGWIRAGGTYDHLELEDAAGDIIADSGHGLGFEAGAGVVLDVGDRLSLTPGVRYRALSRDVEIGTATTEVDLRYVALEVGLVVHF